MPKQSAAKRAYRDEIPGESVKRLIQGIIRKRKSFRARKSNDFLMLVLGFLIVSAQCWSLDTVSVKAVWYVDKDAAAGGDGTSWALAFTEIQPAIDAAFAGGGGEVWVAAGVYDEIRETEYGSIILHEGVSIYGGFAGAEDSFGERNWNLHSVTLDGSHARGGEATYSTVRMKANTLLDGVQVTGGIYRNVLLNGVSHITIRHCRIYGESDTLSGTGIDYSSVGSSYVIIEDCLFENNESGFTVMGSGPLLVTHCLFRSNGGGGGSYCQNTTISDCLFLDNEYGGLYLDASAEGIVERTAFINNQGCFGGGIYFGQVYAQGPYEPWRVLNCLFLNNSTTECEGSFEEGGAVYTACHCFLDKGHQKNRPYGAVQKDAFLFNVEGKEGEGEGEGEGEWEGFYEGGSVECVIWLPRFINCTFAGNRADYAGAIYNESDFDLNRSDQFVNCIFWDNGTDSIYSDADIYPALFNNTVVEGGLPGDMPDFLTPYFRDLSLGDARFAMDSQMLDCGIDSNTAALGGSAVDFLGLPRGYDVVNPAFFGELYADGSRYDLGAYEYPSPVIHWFLHRADQNGDYRINLSELLRVIQLFNFGGYHDDRLGEDGLAPGAGALEGRPHSSDYNPQDGVIDLSELLRTIQLYQATGYSLCWNQGTEDGFCPEWGK